MMECGLCAIVGTTDRVLHIGALRHFKHVRRTPGIAEIRQDFPMTHETIGQRIRRLRISAGLLQRDLAEKARCSSTSVGYVERDMVEVGIYTFIEIARTLGVTLDYLAYGTHSD